MGLTPSCLQLWLLSFCAQRLLCGCAFIVCRAVCCVAFAIFCSQGLLCRFTSVLCAAIAVWHFSRSAVAVWLGLFPAYSACGVVLSLSYAQRLVVLACEPSRHCPGSGSHPPRSGTGDLVSEPPDLVRMILFVLLPVLRFLLFYLWLLLALLFALPLALLFALLLALLMASFCSSLLSSCAADPWQGMTKRVTSYLPYGLMSCCVAGACCALLLSRICTPFVNFMRVPGEGFWVGMCHLRRH